MPFFHRFSSAFRSTSLGSTLPLRGKSPRANTMSSTYFTQGSIHGVGLRQRFYHHHYRFNDFSTQNQALIWAFLGVNAGVFCYHYWAKSEALQGNGASYAFFMRNMTLNLEDVEGGRWWQTITCVFTHLEPYHIGVNMLSLWMVGMPLSRVRGITPVHLAITLIGSGLCGSAGYLLNQYQKMKKTPNSWGLRQYDYSRAVGFSGAISGLMMATAVIMPYSRWYLMGVVPAPLWALALGYMAYDGYYMNKESKTAHAGHLGGAAFGIVYALLRLRGMRI